MNINYLPSSSCSPLRKPPHPAEASETHSLALPSCWAWGTWGGGRLSVQIPGLIKSWTAQLNILSLLEFTWVSASLGQGQSAVFSPWIFSSLHPCEILLSSSVIQMKPEWCTWRLRLKGAGGIYCFKGAGCVYCCQFFCFLRALFYPLTTADKTASTWHQMHLVSTLAWISLPCSDHSWPCQPLLTCVYSTLCVLPSEALTSFRILPHRCLASASVRRPGCSSGSSLKGSCSCSSLWEETSFPGFPTIDCNLLLLYLSTRVFQVSEEITRN